MGSSSSDMDMDSLLANAGYSVRVSELAHVAQRLEQLESVVSNYSSPDEYATLSSHFLSTTTESVNHCNPSDMAAWIECMIQELGPSTDQEEDEEEEDEEIEGEENEGRSRHGSLSLNHTSKATTKTTTTATVTATTTNTNGFSSNLKKEVISCHDSASPVFTMGGYIGKDLFCSGMLLLDEISSDLEATYNHKSPIEDQTSSSSTTTTSSSSSSSSSIAAATAIATATMTNSTTNSTTTSNEGDGAFNATAFLNPTGIELDEESMLPKSGFHHVPQHQDQQVCTTTTSMPSPHGSYGTPAYESFPNTQPPQMMMMMMMDEEMDTTDIMNANPNPNPSISRSPNVMTPFYENTQSAGIDEAGSVVSIPKGSSHDTPHQYHDLHAAAAAAAQESGIRLIHLLMACAECVQNNEPTLALSVAREITGLAASQHGAIGKVAHFFVDALARRACGVNNTPDSPIPLLLLSHSDGFSEMLYFHFYETCPYLKFAHFTANQAILEAFQGHKVVHVIDFNLMQGLQWPALIQALALRPGGPPHLRITGIGLPQVDNKDVLREIGMKLARLASSVNVEFSFRGVIATKLNDVKPAMLEVKEGEAVAVNSILQLHRLLNGETSTGSGGNGSSNSSSSSSNGVSNSIAPIDEVLQSIKAFNPKVVTVVEQEARHNDPRFLNRFVEALHYYCTMFDSLEACGLPPQCREMAYTEEYLGREIMNIVACEGVARVERHEPLEAWRQRMLNSGFRPSHLGSDAFKQASMLLTLFSGEGYTVEENNGCLTLGWHSRPLIAASAWHCG